MAVLCQKSVYCHICKYSPGKGHGFLDEATSTGRGQCSYSSKVHYVSVALVRCNSMVTTSFHFFIATLLTDVDILQCLHDNLCHLPQEFPFYRLVLFSHRPSSLNHAQGRTYRYLIIFQAMQSYKGSSLIPRPSRKAERACGVLSNMPCNMSRPYGTTNVIIAF